MLWLAIGTIFLDSCLSLLLPSLISEKQQRTSPPSQCRHCQLRPVGQMLMRKGSALCWFACASPSTSSCSNVGSWQRMGWTKAVLQWHLYCDGPGALFLPTQELEMTARSSPQTGTYSTVFCGKIVAPVMVCNYIGIPALIPRPFQFSIAVSRECFATTWALDSALARLL